MAIIEGQVESLKKLKDVLHQNGLTQFSSIAELNEFLKNYETEKSKVPIVIQNEWDKEIDQLQSRLIKQQDKYNTIKSNATRNLNNKLQNIGEQLESTKKKGDKSFLHKIFYFRKKIQLSNKKSNLQNNFENIIKQTTHRTEQEICRIEGTLENYKNNKGFIISDRCNKLLQELNNTKSIIDSAYNLIAGAIGEHSVVKEIEKLADNFYLFNDFSVEFYPPIYNKKENERIHSIQIDHLLICQSGIYILETKNWAKQSLTNIDLRSPVEQIRRSSYAIFMLLNGQSKRNKINLNFHHWGDKQIPVRNLIVMTNAVPKEKFKHVKVLSLKELNGYVSYFDPIFSRVEIESICNYLRGKMSS